MDFQTLRFIIVAAILYGAMHFVYHKVPDETLRTVIYPNLIGHAAAATINTLTPDRKIRVFENKISSNKAVLNIVRGCDGSGILFMITAATLGFGARFKQTIVGLILGTALVYVVNQIRIVGIYYLIEYNRAWFPAMHTYYAPTLIVFIVAGYFLWWSRWATVHDNKQAAPT